MDKPFFKNHSYTTVHGLNPVLDLEQDRPRIDIEQAHKRKLEEEEQRKALMNRHLDPFYMETNLPDEPDTGSISLDPNDMTFNF